jgi:hypothetical protein
LNSLDFYTAIHDSTKCVPDKFLLGRELKVAYGNLKRARSEVLQRFNVNRKAHEYQVGDTVLYKMRLES